jgi:hypothetical protein
MGRYGLDVSGLGEEPVAGLVNVVMNLGSHKRRRIS